jgi:hypothetical protein
MEFELKKMKVNIPYMEIAKRLSKERNTSGQSVQQHLNKMRHRMLNQGCWVPPLSGRASSSKLPDIRGVVQVKDENGNWVEKNVEWDDDISIYVQPGDIDDDPSEIAASVEPERLNPTGRTADQRKVKLRPNYPANRRKYNTRKATLASARNAVDPADLDADEEYDPMAKGKVKNKAKSKALTNALVKKEREDTPRELCETCEPDEPSHEVDSRMMGFSESDQERTSARKIAALLMQPSNLARFPAGVSGRGDDVYEPKDVIYAPKDAIYSASHQEDLDRDSDEDYEDHEDYYESESADERMVEQSPSILPEAGAGFAMSGVGPNAGFEVLDVRRDKPHYGIRNDGPTQDSNFMATSEYNGMVKGRNEMANPYDTTGYAGQLFNQNTYDQTAHDRNAYNQNEQNQNDHNENDHNQNEHNYNEYSQNAYSQNAYSQNAYDQNAYSQNAYDQNAHDQNPCDQNGFNQNSFLQTAFPYDNNGYVMTDDFGLPISGSMMNGTGLGLFAGINNGFKMSNEIGMVSGAGLNSDLSSNNGFCMQENGYNVEGGMGGLVGTATSQAVNPAVIPSLDAYSDDALGSYEPVHAAETIASGRAFSEHVNQHHRVIADPGADEDILTDDGNVDEEEVINPYTP